MDCAVLWFLIMPDNTLLFLLTQMFTCAHLWPALPPEAVLMSMVGAAFQGLVLLVWAPTAGGDHARSQYGLQKQCEGTWSVLALTAKIKEITLVVVSITADT